MTGQLNDYFEQLIKCEQQQQLLLLVVEVVVAVVLISEPSFDAVACLLDNLHVIIIIFFSFWFGATIVLAV